MSYGRLNSKYRKENKERFAEWQKIYDADPSRKKEKNLLQRQRRKFMIKEIKKALKHPDRLEDIARILFEEDI
jgi:hypothetical protein